MNDKMTLPADKWLFDTEECCELLNIKPKLFYSLIARGLIRKHPAFKKCLVSAPDLELFAFRQGELTQKKKKE